MYLNMFVHMSLYKKVHIHIPIHVESRIYLGLRIGKQELNLS